jgi:hypothetical protein
LLYVESWQNQSWIRSQLGQNKVTGHCVGLRNGGCCTNFLILCIYVMCYS